eukprot:TRINITY_DN1698_c0_g1_i14.p1 TRINITY_DN1698_c0_g1~~TRINITY_DN1698_c0_g1_i14.p1  ORF type:complete len:135 (+),score=22.37 TRINITY_DN1698_c0_g1_i14:369-773(+)
MEVLENNPQARIAYEKDSEVVILEWLDYNNEEQFRRHSTMSRDVAAQKHAKKLLVDTEHLKMISKEAQLFTSSIVIPQLREAGVRVIAVVNSIHYFAQVGGRAIQSQVDKNLTTIEFFNNREEAFAWLKSIDMK